MRLPTFVLLVPFLTVPLAVTTSAHAEDPAAAQQLFSEAKRLIKLGSWAAACPKLEESQRLDPGMGTQFNLADCNEHVGKTATAWAGFLDVAATAKAGNQGAREKAARLRAAALEPRLARVTLLVRGSEPGLEVTRDGIEVGRPQWGSAMPVDPGTHNVSATAPGKKLWETTVRVAAGPSAVDVEIPSLDNAPAPLVPVAAAVLAPQPVVPPPPSVDHALPAPTPLASSEVLQDRPSATSGRRTAGAVIAGAGVIGLGVGTVFALLSKGKHDKSSDHCRGNVCDASGASMRDDAIAAGNISTIAFGAGAAALLGGGILWLTAPRAAVARSAHVEATPLVGSSGTGFALRGAW